MNSYPILFNFSSAYEMQTSNADIFVTIDRLVVSPRVDVWCRLEVSTTTGKASKYLNIDTTHIHYSHTIHTHTTIL